MLDYDLDRLKQRYRFIKSMSLSKFGGNSA